MAWIESHQALEKHPKVLRLSRAASWSVPEAIGKLHIFWWWCLDYATDGRLGKHGDEVIANVFGVTTDCDKFVALLNEIGFVDSEPEIRVHDWWDYAGRFLQVRYKRTPKIWKEIKRFYGHSIQRTNNRTTTEQQPINNHKPNQPNLTNLTRPNLTNPLSSRRRSTSLAPSKSAAVWESYSEAYRAVYGVEPVRNQQTNSQLCKLVDKLGEEEASCVAAFYLSHKNPYYVQKRHPPGLLLYDAEGLRTQWATGVKATTSEAKHAEFKDNVVGKIERVQQILNERGAG